MVALHVAVMAALVPALALAPAPAQAAQGLPSFAQVREQWRSSEAWLLDRHGQPLQRQRLDGQARRLDWIALEDISPALRTAIVLSEDRHFYQHSGIDWSAVAAVSFRNLFNHHTRGASTLTMQLAGLLDESIRRGNRQRSLAQKIDQAWVASRLEHRWRKDEILEAYLNLAPFRGELVGIDAVSQTLFGKHPAGLNAREAAVAAALLRGPNAAPDLVGRRACGVLAQMNGTPVDDCLAMEGFARLALARRPDPGDARLAGAEQIAPHLARQLLKQPHSRVTSSLDAGVQRVARQALTRHLGQLAGRHVEDGAVLVLDNRSGEVLAWVGSSGALSSAAAVDGVTALRQAGSTLKPFVYGLAIEQRLLTAASLLDDSPVDLATTNGLYIPQNYDHHYKGAVSLRAALGASLNIPAVRTLVMVTPDALFERMRALGFESLRMSGDYYGYSLALGSADISLLALTNAYRALANGGRYGPVTTVPVAATAAAGAQRDASRQVFDPAAAFIVADVMADRNARVMTFGSENTLALRSWAAVKTGTSKDMRDNWCVGFTDRYTVGVWVGNFSGAPMWNVSGTSGAAPVWADVVNHLHRHRASRPPSPPDGLVRRHVEFDGGLEPARSEWFVRGTELDRVTRVMPAQRPLAIAAPVDGARYALDPDIPPANQKLRFEAQGAGATMAVWRLDGREAGRGEHLDWAPMPGRHRLELVRDGRVTATVGFEVNGARLKDVAAQTGRRS